MNECILQLARYCGQTQAASGRSDHSAGCGCACDRIPRRALWPGCWGGCGGRELGVGEGVGQGWDRSPAKGDRIRKEN